MIKTLENFNIEFQKQYELTTPKPKTLPSCQAVLKTLLQKPDLEPGLFSSDPPPRGLIVCLLFILLILILSALLPSLLGYSWFNVISDSMDREIPKGSFIIVKRTDSELICIGDNVTYKCKDGSTVTHKVINIIENCGGSSSRGFETRGTENSNSDTYIVLEENVVGVVQTHINGLGSFFALLKQLFFLFIAAAAFTVFIVTRRTVRKKKLQQLIQF